MKNPYLLFFLALFFLPGFSVQIYAQTVSTFLTGNGLNGPDGFALDVEQNLFVANWGGGAGTTLLKITPGAMVSTFDSACDAPDGLAFDETGNLYVSNYNSGIIDKITPSGARIVFATGLINPSALAFDTAGNLYVSNHGSTTVSKISPGGVVTTFATGFSKPLGLTFDFQGNLYVSNYSTGIVHKVLPDGTASVFAAIPGGQTSKIQYLVRGQSGNFYLPAYGHHKIYRISITGEVTVFAGTGVPGSANGPVDSAQFNGPNSIALTSEGDLYISEYNANRIRRITGVEFPVGLEPTPGGIKSNGGHLLIFPNPFSATTNIIMESSTPGEFRIQIIDTSGKTIKLFTIHNNPQERNCLSFDRNSMAAGVYVCRLIFENRVVCQQKMNCVDHGKITSSF